MGDPNELSKVGPPPRLAARAALRAWETPTSSIRWGEAPAAARCVLRACCAPGPTRQPHAPGPTRPAPRAGPKRPCPSRIALCPWAALPWSSMCTDGGRAAGTWGTCRGGMGGRAAGAWGGVPRGIGGRVAGTYRTMTGRGRGLKWRTAISRACKYARKHTHTHTQTLNHVRGAVWGMRLQVATMTADSGKGGKCFCSCGGETSG